MEETGEGLKDSPNKNPKSILEARPNTPGKNVETLSNSSDDSIKPEASDALASKKPENEGKGGESQSAGPNDHQSPVSGEIPLQESQDLKENLPFPNSTDDSDYLKINSKKGIISMILGFLEFLLRIFGFKKDKFPKI